MNIRRTQPALLSACLALALASCGDGRDGTERSAGARGDTDALPAPQQGTGSITGMPGSPGPGSVPIAGAALPEAEPAEESTLPPLEDNPETGLLPADTGAVAGDGGVVEAVAVVRDYYAAINAGNFGRAYSFWSDGGRSSGQSPQQFADGFAETVGVTVQIGEPGAIEGAPGSRFVEVPVSVSATRRDGDVRRFRGSFILRRSAVEGPAAGQAAWRIASADLREAQP